MLKFTPTIHDKSEKKDEKARFYTQFVTFVDSGFARSEFPKWFYTRLSMTFGHIAHYNQDGFYDEYFGSLNGMIRFVNDCMAGGGYGDPEYTYSDVEVMLKDWMRKDGILERLLKVRNAENEKAERAELARLKAKYEPTLFTE